MTIKEFFCGNDMLADPLNFGPLTDGHYIQIGLGTGFYIPEADYQAAHTRANEARAIQFVAVASDGRAVHATRDELLDNPQIVSAIAWIFPDPPRPAEPAVICPCGADLRAIPFMDLQNHDSHGDSR